MGRSQSPVEGSRSKKSKARKPPRVRRVDSPDAMSKKIRAADMLTAHFHGLAHLVEQVRADLEELSWSVDADPESDLADLLRVIDFPHLEESVNDVIAQMNFFGLYPTRQPSVEVLDCLKAFR